jgi:pimeloyl-ACP methyl ester carboxylesterase
MGLPTNQIKVDEEVIAGKQYSFIADVYRPRNPTCAVLLGPSWFATGERVSAWAQRLTREAGAVSMVLHFPGHGKSPGLPGVINLEQQIRCFELARQVSTYITPKDAPVFYGGSSGGFTAALYAAAKDKSARALFGICPFHSMRAYGPMKNPGLQHAFEQAASEGIKVNLAKVDGRSEDVLLDLQYSLPSLNRIDLDTLAAQITVPLWIGYGTRDTIVDPDCIDSFISYLHTEPQHVQSFDYPAEHGLPGYDDKVEEQIASFVYHQQERR